MLRYIVDVIMSKVTLSTITLTRCVSLVMMIPYRNHCSTNLELHPCPTLLFLKMSRMSRARHCADQASIDSERPTESQRSVHSTDYRCSLSAAGGGKKAVSVASLQAIAAGAEEMGSDQRNYVSGYLFRQIP